MSWREQAACKGMDPALFFPSRGESWAEAKAVCRECPVAQECLEDALQAGERFGIRGGTSGRERRRVGRTPRANKCVICGALVGRSAKTCSGGCREIRNHRLRVAAPSVPQGTVAGFWNQGWGEAS